MTKDEILNAPIIFTYNNIKYWEIFKDEIEYSELERNIENFERNIIFRSDDFDQKYNREIGYLQLNNVPFLIYHLHGKWNEIDTFIINKKIYNQFFTLVKTKEEINDFNNFDNIDISIQTILFNRLNTIVSNGIYNSLELAQVLVKKLINSPNEFCTKRFNFEYCSIINSWILLKEKEGKVKVITNIKRGSWDWFRSNIEFEYI